MRKFLVCSREIPEVLSAQRTLTQIRPMARPEIGFRRSERHQRG
jgi:hypothetical protein